jgi:N-acetylglucosamine kinase-like BadF-type ATPase
MKIGVDGGGTKTGLILVDEAGAVVARQLAPGCNPSVTGPEQAGRILTEALAALRAQAPGPAQQPDITMTLLCMAGSPDFWKETAATLTGCGRVEAVPDSLPVLELATDGGPGLVLHAGTGSFVAARAPDGSVHRAGGLGWRFGDPGSGYDLGRRAIARALLELQGWAPPSRLTPLVRDHAGGGDAGAITRFFYHGETPTRQIAALAPAVLHLAAEGDPVAHFLMVESVSGLLDLAEKVAARLFPGVPAGTLRAGLSGPILTRPVVVQALAPRSLLQFAPVEGAAIEGVRRLLLER